MKKHIIAALVGVMILAVTAPAFAANVGGSINLGYKYDLIDESAETSGDWGLNVAGNISNDVSFKLGFETDPMTGDPTEIGYSQLLNPNEAWIQAKNTPVGTAKLGAFDMAFGERNETSWTDDGALNVQVGNEIAGMNVTGGVQFEEDGNVQALGASLGMEPMDAVSATVGVLATRSGSDWEPAVGYELTYAGIDNLALGLKGNLKEEEIVGSAEYEIMPGIAVEGMYAQNALNDDDEEEDSRAQVGVTAKFENGLHAKASYALVNQDLFDENTITTLSGGYEFQPAKGLTVGVDGKYVIDELNGNDSSIKASAGIEF